jgi:hypothetical protein
MSNEKIPCCLISFKNDEELEKINFLKEKLKEKTMSKTIRKGISILYDFYKKGIIENVE